MKIRIFLTIIFLIPFVGGVNAFPSINIKADSLKTLLAAKLENNRKINDTASINSINQLAASVFESNPDSTLYYSNIAIANSRRIQYDKGIADGLLQVAHVNYFKGNYTSAKKNIDETIKIYSKLNDYKGTANSYLTYAKLYNRLADYPLALNYLKLSLDLNKKLKDEQAIANCYATLGIVYDNKGQSSTALDYYFKSLAIDIKYHNKLAAADNYNNIGVVLQNMEIYPKSLEYFQHAIKTWLEVNDVQGIGTAYQNIGEVLMAQKHYERALNYFSIAIKIALKQDDKDGISSLYYDFGLCFAHKKQFHLALMYLNKSLKSSTNNKIEANRANALIGFATVYNQQGDYKHAYDYALQAQQLTAKFGNPLLRVNTSLQISKALAGLKKYDESYHALQRYVTLKDSLKSNESTHKLTSYILESNFANKQRLYNEQQKQREYLYHQKIQKQILVNTVCLIIIIGMVIILIIYYRVKLKLQKINKLLEDKNTEVSQQKTDIDEQAYKLNELNTLKDRLISVLAHDLRSPLSTLRGLFTLLEDENISFDQLQIMLPQVLKKLDYTTDFLDTLLLWINSQMDTFNTTTTNFRIKDLVAYEIENHNEQALAKGINLIDKVPEDICVVADENSIRIVIRNLITNAIKFSQKNDTIKVSAFQQDELNVLITVKDSGIGMSAETISGLFKSRVASKVGTNNESGTGMGLLFCKDLVKKCNGKIWVTSKPDVGTEFSILLPIGKILHEQTKLALA